LKKEKKQKEMENDEEADITTETKIRNKSFHLYLACISHMTP